MLIVQGVIRGRTKEQNSFGPVPILTGASDTPGRLHSNSVKSASQNFISLDTFLCTVSTYFLAFVSHCRSTPFGRSYITLAETDQIAIMITLCISSLIIGFNWVTFFGTPLIPSMCSDEDEDLPGPSAACPWCCTESDSGSLNSSTPLLKAERIYGYPVKAIEME